MARRTLYMETTTVDPQKTAGEIISELVKAGATSINTDYKDGSIAGLRWIMRVDGCDVLFDMPVRVEPIFNIFQARRSWPPNHTKCDREQAIRVAWRQLLRWVQAQNAMIDCGMVKPEEVYLPYAVGPAGKTLFQMMSESKFKMLAAPVEQ